MRYRVELEELLAFVEKLRGFEQRAEVIAARVDGQIAALHTSWSGDAAAAHRANHDEWTAAATQMREALTQLREAARNAHRNYTDAVKVNLEMLS
ncbi:MAG TPA: WXG100 family type VII secretion target [Mycobacterium sp.]|nr:WXG100 family type VII secretion target [Mycobacterium sp.]